jgi:hypothetical protein
MSTSTDRAATSQVIDAVRADVRADIADLNTMTAMLGEACQRVEPAHCSDGNSLGFLPHSVATFRALRETPATTTPIDRAALLQAIDAAIAFHRSAIASMETLRTVVLAAVVPGIAHMTVHRAKATVSNDTVETPVAHSPIETVPSAAIAPAPVAVAERVSSHAMSSTERSWKRRGLKRAHGIKVKAKGRIEDLIAAQGCNAAPSEVQRGCNVSAVAPVAPSVAPVAPSLSPSKNLLSSEYSNKESLKRERRRGATLHPTAAVAPLAADWEPDDLSRKMAIDKLGEIGAANCVAKFRDYHSSSGHNATPAAWETKFRNWVRDERSSGSPANAPTSDNRTPWQRQKDDARAAVRNLRDEVASRLGDGVWITQDTPQWDAWKRYRGGKSFPPNRAGKYLAPSEWPPADKAANQ